MFNYFANFFLSIIFALLIKYQLYHTFDKLPNKFPNIMALSKVGNIYSRV